MDRRLYRSRKNKVVAGIAGGLGEYFDIDPVLVRVIFVLATLASGFGVLTYLILWVVIPYEPIQYTAAEASPAAGGTPEAKPHDFTQGRHHRRGSVVAGSILIVLGGLFLLQNYLPEIRFHDTWPLILVAIGAAMVFNSMNRDDHREESHEG